MYGTPSLKYFILYSSFFAFSVKNDVFWVKNVRSKNFRASSMSLRDVSYLYLAQLRGYGKSLT